MNYDVRTDELRDAKAASAIPQTYDIGIDEMRDVTQADVQKFEMLIQVFGHLNPMNRALATLPSKVARGEVTLQQVRNATKIWTDMLGLDNNGR